MYVGTCICLIQYYIYVSTYICIKYICTYVYCCSEKMTLIFTINFVSFCLEYWYCTPEVPRNKCDRTVALVVGCLAINSTLTECQKGWGDVFLQSQLLILT